VVLAVVGHLVVGSEFAADLVLDAGFGIYVGAVLVVGY